MQKQITTHKGDTILLIEIENGSHKFDIDKAIYTSLYNLTLGKSEATISNKEIDCEIIGTTSTLNDKDVEPFVEEIYGELDGGDDSELYFRNYKIKTDDDYFDNFHFKVPLKSWKSFLQYNDIDLSKEWVVLKILKQ